MAAIGRPGTCSCLLELQLEPPFDAGKDHPGLLSAAHTAKEKMRRFHGKLHRYRKSDSKWVPVQSDISSTAPLLPALVGESKLLVSTEPAAIVLVAFWLAFNLTKHETSDNF
jgi:hypothetical protein